MEVDIYLMTDQPETCRKCGVRTLWFDNTNDIQTHECPNCRYYYVLEAEEDSAV